MPSAELASKRGRGRPPIDANARREELLDAAERVIARDGIGTTMAEIAAEAGYARTVVYAAFPNLSAVAHALTLRHTMRMMVRIDEMLAGPMPLREALRGAVDLICAFVEENPSLYPLMMQTWVSAGDTPNRPLLSTIVDWIEPVVVDILRRLDVDPAPARVWACVIAGSPLLAAEDWNGQRTQTRAELVDSIMTLLWPGLAALGADRLSGPMRPA